MPRCLRADACDHGLLDALEKYAAGVLTAEARSHTLATDPVDVCEQHIPAIIGARQCHATPTIQAEIRTHASFRPEARPRLKPPALEPIGQNADGFLRVEGIATVTDAARDEPPDVVACAVLRKHATFWEKTTLIRSRYVETLRQRSWKSATPRARGLSSKIFWPVSFACGIAMRI
jgi:hypothetical protein